MDKKIIYIIVRVFGEGITYQLREMPDEYFLTLNRGNLVESGFKSIEEAVEKVKELKGILYVNSVSQSYKEVIERELAIGELKEKIQNTVPLLSEDRMRHIRKHQEIEYAWRLDDVAV